MKIKGTLVHPVETKNRWVIAWKSGASWVTEFHKLTSKDTSLIKGSTIEDLCNQGAATFASCNGAIRRMRRAGYTDDMVELRAASMIRQAVEGDPLNWEI